MGDKSGLGVKGAGFDQAAEHFADVSAFGVQGFLGLAVDITDFLGYFKLGLEFRQGAFGNVQKPWWLRV